MAAPVCDPGGPLATKAGLTPGELLGAVVRASFEHGGPITDLIIASAFPRVVQATVKRALKPNGVEDRMLLMEHMRSCVDRVRATSPYRQVSDHGAVR